MGTRTLARRPAAVAPPADVPGVRRPAARARVALVTETFYPAVDGTTTTLRQVADHLIDGGHEVLVVAPGPGLGTYRRSRVARIGLHDTGGRRRDPGRQVRRALEAFAPDLVHVTSPGVVGRKALKHAALMGVPALVVQHTTVRPRTDLAREWWLSRVASRAARVVVTADHVADRLHDLGVTAEVWEPGVDADCFTPSLRDPWLHARWARTRSHLGAQVVVGYAGSLHQRHGVRRLAEVAGVAGTRLVVIGGGPQESWLRRHAPGAVLTGPLSTGHLATALASLDLMVRPGVDEACCHSLREAAASGVPLVAPRAGGALRVVRDLENGLLYDPDHPLGLVRAVDSVAADRHRLLLGRRGRELALARSWHDACRELVREHYDPLLPPALRTGLTATSTPTLSKRCSGLSNASDQ